MISMVGANVLRVRLEPGEEFLKQATHIYGLAEACRSHRIEVATAEGNWIFLEAQSPGWRRVTE